MGNSMHHTKQLHIFTVLKCSRGFSLVELIIVSVIFLIIMGVMGNSFNMIMKEFSLQSKNAESNISGIIGLEILRGDLASAGYGLFWTFPSAVPNYDEAANTPMSTYNHGVDGAGSPLPPRALDGGNNISSSDEEVLFNLSDYLVIRSTMVAGSRASKRWSYLVGAAAPATFEKENLVSSDRIIVERIVFDKITGTSKELVYSGSNFYTTFTAANLASFAPSDPNGVNYIYGIDPDTNLRFPFNRADYYVRKPASSEFNKLPKRCAPHTGILFKATIAQSGGGENDMPLLDCVADMQVVYAMDYNNDGTIDNASKDTLTDASNVALDAQGIREQVKNISVYILTHEGGKDTNYSYPTTTIGVGPGDGVTSGTGRTFNLSTVIGPDYKYYRWKVYRISVRPKNTMPEQM